MSQFGELPPYKRRFKADTGGGWFRPGGKHSPRSLKTRVGRRATLIKQLEKQIAEGEAAAQVAKQTEAMIRQIGGSLYDMTTAELLKVAKHARSVRKFLTQARRSR